MAGQLFLIGTPLGNLGDLSARAIDTLRRLDALYCEDTRHTGKLAAHFGINVPLRALHDDSPPQHWQDAVDHVVGGKRVGYASDAGMPVVSDPGRRLLRAAWDRGIAPIVIPGPSAVTTIASYCPFIAAEFAFIGFAPRKAGERAAFVQRLTDSSVPSIFFEAPSRVHATLAELCAALDSERELVVGRELTKLHEQAVLLKAGEWDARQSTIPELGEFTIAVAAAPEVEQEVDSASLNAALARLQAAGFTRKDALKALAAVWNLPANRLKALAYGKDDQR